jgi:hypothetical protein
MPLFQAGIATIRIFAHLFTHLVFALFGIRLGAKEVFALGNVLQQPLNVGWNGFEMQLYRPGPNSQA